MGFVQAVKTCFGKYVDFHGRASRSEYWFWYLLLLLVFGATIVLMPLKPHAGIGGSALANATLILLVCAALFMPTLAVTVRRWHDTNSSGWWLLLYFLPYVGALIITVWSCIKGTGGDNRFGPAPLNPVAVEAFD